jgi:hypothetical protein
MAKGGTPRDGISAGAVVMAEQCPRIIDRPEILVFPQAI